MHESSAPVFARVPDGTAQVFVGSTYGRPGTEFWTPERHARAQEKLVQDVKNLVTDAFHIAEEGHVSVVAINDATRVSLSLGFSPEWEDRMARTLERTINILVQTEIIRGDNNV